MTQRSSLNQQPIIKAMTRIPTIWGIPYSFWAIMLLISTAGIVILKSFLWFLGLFVGFYFLGRLIARHDVFLVDILITKLTHCPTTQNDSYWGCKSYDPW